jgi:hypothetical protein
MTSLVRPSIAKLKPYSSARDEFQGDSAIFLDANESPFETGVNRYPDPLQRALKQRIAVIKGVDADRIFLGNGSDEVLDLIFRAYCEPGQDNVIILPPTYGMYKVLADLNGVECREVLLTPDFEPDVEKILRMADRHSKVLFLCSPNNPSGNAFSAESMERLLRGFAGLVVVDEAYVDFCIERTLSATLGGVSQPHRHANIQQGLRIGGHSFGNGLRIRRGHHGAQSHQTTLQHQQPDAAVRARSVIRHASGGVSGQGTFGRAEETVLGIDNRAMGRGGVPFGC